MANRAVYFALLATDCVGSIVAIACGFALGARLVPGLAGIAAGTLWYSFGEYAIHRWLYHRGSSPLTRVHAHHHHEPDELLGLPLYSISVAALHGLAAAALGGAPVGLVFGGAVLFSHGQQGVIHHAAHRYAHLDVLGTRSPLRRHHALHHKTGVGNYGISSTLWDRLLGTYSCPLGVVVPRHVPVTHRRARMTRYAAKLPEL